MTPEERMLALIPKCDDPAKLQGWVNSARRQGNKAVEEAAFRRLIQILPKEAPGTVEHDLWRTIHAFEHVLTEERGKTTRLGRTRQKVARVGEVHTLKDWAIGAKNTEGFDMLIERGMPELTGEAIVLRHAARFDEAVVAAARQRLEAAGVNTGALVA